MFCLRLRPYARLIALVAVAGLAATERQVQGQTAASPQVGASNAPFWAGVTDAAAFERAMDARLAHARIAKCSAKNPPSARSPAPSARQHGGRLVGVKCQHAKRNDNRCAAARATPSTAG